MRLDRLRFLGFVCCGVLAACGGRSTADLLGSGRGGSGAAAGGTGTTAGGTASSGASTGVGGAMAQGGGAPIGPSKCAAYEDEASYTMVVRFTNQTSRVIHLGQQQVNCNFDPLFRVIEDGTGMDLVTSIACPTNCWALRVNGAVGGCPGICAYPLTISLAPQESFDLNWDGRHLVNTVMLQMCLADPALAPECVRARQVLPSLHTFWAEAGTTLDCGPTIGTCGECLPREEGGCTTPAALISGQILTAKLQVKLDPGYGVGKTGGGPPLPVELFFNE